ncbi:hypothetical protein QFZ98_004449 [Paraburkholderia youngii]
MAKPNSTTNCGHSSNRCCPLPNYGEPVIRVASRSTIVRCSPAFSSFYRQACVETYCHREMGCGSGMSCWRRLRDWQAAGVWEHLHEVLLARSRPNRLASRHRRLLFNPRCGLRSKTGPNPTDRARPGSKHPLITEAQGIPLAVILTGANRNDATQLQALVEAIPAIGGKRGRPLSKPRVVQGDRDYDHDKYRRPLHAPALQPKSLDVVSLMVVG